MTATPDARRQRGFTLTELAVASAMGLFLLSGIIFIFITSVKANTQALKRAHLHHVLSTAMSAMRSELRRAGYWSRAEEAVMAGARNGFSAIHVVGAHCVLFTYDRDEDDADGRPDAGDQFGFRLVANRIQAKTSDGACSGTTCATCDSGRWWSMTDPQRVTVSELRFTELETLSAAGQAAVREITIVVSASLRSDRTVSLTLRTTVGIRNDEML